MSIDLAWRRTIGDPDVRIVVTDSGIEWDSADLIDKVWLNYRSSGASVRLEAGGACDGSRPREAARCLACSTAEELAQKGFDCWPIDPNTKRSSVTAS